MDFAAEAPALAARAQRDFAFAIDRVGGVADEIDQDLLQVRGVGGNEQIRAWFNGELHVGGLDARCHQ